MKRIHLLTAVTLLLLALCVCVCAQAVDIRPLDTDHAQVDLNNGTFCLGVKDIDRIVSGGFFTASLYLEDHYDGKQIEALAPGDTVTVNGKTWTVREVVPHLADEPGLVDTYEIYTEEENAGYIVFSHASDGCYLCITDDWTPVTHVADVRIMLPLPDRFEYLDPNSGDSLDQYDFINQIGNYLIPYNTSCTFEDGVLVRVIHSDYPVGPEDTFTEEVAAEEPAVAEASVSAEESSDGIPVWKFCHGVREGLETAVIKGYSNSCEEGPIEIEMTPEEIEDIRDIAINGVITGKANDMSLTGGTWGYVFESPDGQYLLSIEMYKGWIVDAATGMYNYSR